MHDVDLIWIPFSAVFLCFVFSFFPFITVEAGDIFVTTISAPEQSIDVLPRRLLDTSRSQWRHGASRGRAKQPACFWPCRHFTDVQAAIVIEFQSTPFPKSLLLRTQNNNEEKEEKNMHTNAHQKNYKKNNNKTKSSPFRNRKNCPWTIELFMFIFCFVSFWDESVGECYWLLKKMARLLL